MIEVYLFLVAFTLQIVAISVLIPVRFTRRIRSDLASIPASRLAEVYPGVDVARAYERILTQYRVTNRVVAALGLLLLGWFLSYMQRPEWREGAVSGIVTAYFFLQNFPLMLIAWLVRRFNLVHKRSLPEAKRKAMLQRRGLFDFVSPLQIALAALAYLQFVLFVFYIARHPFPGFAGPLVNIVMVTLMDLMLASVVYWMMYRRKRGPLETHENRMHVTRFVARSYAYMCILIPVFLSFTFARKLLDLETWGPFGSSLSFLILMFMMLRIQGPFARSTGSATAAPVL